MFHFARGECIKLLLQILVPARSSPPEPKSSEPAFRVGRSRTGLGLFAVKPIKKGAFIAEYWGKIIPTKLADELNTKYLFEINTRWTVDGSDRRNVARYINHSCRPNAETYIVKHKIKVSATKNIKPGEEITYNYGRNYFDMFLKPVGCKCVACLERAKKKRNGHNGVNGHAAANGHNGHKGGNGRG